MFEWLYRTTTSQTTDTDASGKPCTKEVWEAKLLWGQIVYQSAKIVPRDSPGAAASSPPPTSPSSSPTAPESLKSHHATQARGATEKAPAKPVTLADRVARESHWLDVDRTADSRAQSPDLPDSPPGLVGPENVQRRRSVGVLGYNVFGDAVAAGQGGEGTLGKVKERGKRERYESTWVDVDRTEDSRAQTPELDEAVGRSSGEKKVGGSPLADPKNN